MHPLQNDVYVLHAGQVQLVPAASLRAASSPLADLFSPSLLDDKTRILSLQLPGFTLRQNEQGGWTRSPEMKGLSSDQINRLVDEWRYARALSVAADSGQPVRERVILTVLDNDRPRPLEFGIRARRPELVLVRFDEQLEFHFQEDAGERLLVLRPEPEPEPDPSAPSAPATR